MFYQSGSNWSQQAELTAPGASQFGSSVAIYGSTVVVGAPATNYHNGTAYVFVRSGGTWSQQAELTPPGLSGEFGNSVAIYQSTAIVGARYDNAFTGAAYVFVRSGSTWSRQAELTPSNAAEGALFGYSVALYGPTAVVGADQAVQAEGGGAAYVFVRSGSTWSQQAKLTASDVGEYFGYSVAIYGSAAVIGAPSNNSNTGAAYVFVRSGSSWSQQAELTPSDAASGDQFGHSVALYGSAALVGAIGGNMGAGAAYVFDQSGSTWSQQTMRTASDGRFSDYLGYSVAIYQSTAIAGAIGNDSWTGAAYVFPGA